MRKKLFLLSFALSMVVFFGVSTLFAGNTRVMPEKYAYVADMNSTDLAQFGDSATHTWNKIILWGKTTNAAYIGHGYSYSWDYGDGSAPSPMTSVGSYNAAVPFSPSAEYLCSDQHLYPTVNTDKKYYTAVLRILNNMNMIVSSTTVTVTYMNLNSVDAGHGYSSSDIPIVKRSFIEQITKGRGLTTLYLTQDRSGTASNGSWPGQVNYPGVSHGHPITLTTYLPVMGTALTLKAFLINGHGVDDPCGDIDPYYEAVINGFNYIFSMGQIMPAYDDSNPGATSGFYNSDMNGNGKMIFFAGAGFTCGWDRQFTQMYQHGLCMQALSLFRNVSTMNPSYTVNIGPAGSSTPMSFLDVVKDAVDYAVWGQQDGSANSGSGWRFIGRYVAANPYPWDFQPNWTWPLAIYGTSLSDTIPVVSGLEAIEKKWGIKAPNVVREKLDRVVWMMQQQIAGWGTASEWGAGVINELLGSASCAHNETKSYSAYVGMWSTDWMGSLEATVGLLQVMNYLSMDTTLTTECQCGATDCQVGAKATDFKLNMHGIGDCTGSCLRIGGAINWIGTHQFVSPPVFQIVEISEVLRLNNYMIGGVNNGLLGQDPQGASLPTMNGASFQWEDTYSSVVTKTMAEDILGDGRWQWSTSSVGNYGDISDAWAILSLSPVVSPDMMLKTEHKSPHIIQEASRGQEVEPFCPHL